MKKTRLFYTSAQSNKFWEIGTQGKRAEICYGKTGSAGRVLTKTFHSASAAIQYAEKQIQQKTNKGYQKKNSAKKKTGKKKVAKKLTSKKTISKKELDQNIEKLRRFEEYLRSYKNKSYIDSSSFAYHMEDPRWYIEFYPPNADCDKHIAQIESKFGLILSDSFKAYLQKVGTFAVFNFHGGEIYKLLSPLQMINESKKIVNTFFKQYGDNLDEIIDEEDIHILKHSLIIEISSEECQLLISNINSKIEFYEWEVNIDFQLYQEIESTLLYKVRSLKSFNQYLNRLIKNTKQQIFYGN